MSLRYAAERDKKYRILDLTSLTVEEFESLVAPFETAFLARMQDWTLEGKPRTGRRYSQYANCPLPSPEDRLLFILTPKPFLELPSEWASPKPISGYKYCCRRSALLWPALAICRRAISPRCASG
jgi:hypothetical protein